MRITKVRQRVVVPAVREAQTCLCEGVQWMRGPTLQRGYLLCCLRVSYDYEPRDVILSKTRIYTRHEPAG